MLKFTSRTLVEFHCRCGNTSYVRYGNLDRTATCGRCSFQPKVHWLGQEYGKLHLFDDGELPEEWAPNSHRKFTFLCSCSRLTHLSFQKVTHGNTQSCGRCNHKPKEYWLSKTFGKLKLVDFGLMEEWPGGSNKRFRFTCTCGREHTAVFNNVTKGDVQSCGKCSHHPRDYWYAQRWGKLKLAPQPFPESLPLYSMKKFLFICLCGKSANLQFSHVTQGASTSCGKCNWMPISHWESMKWGMLSLVQGQVVGELSPKSNLKLRFRCDCGQEVTTRFADVSDGSSHSCGCLQIGENEFSEESEVRQYLSTLTWDTHLTSYPIPGSRKSYDVYIPSIRLAVEYHGLIWHSARFYKQQQDNDKFELAVSRGDRLIQIYSDEWRDKQAIMKEMLRSLIQPKAGKRIKPTFEVHHQTPNEAREFLNKHHYLGAASGCLTVVARHGEAVVGVWVFMKRETGTVLWHRACWDHAYKAWNPHEKALALAIPELKALGFTRIITFSDNRFHTGKLYESLGFDFETTIPPDYGYTNGTRRVSKFAFRVKAGIKEQTAAEAQGWYRIWDSGKRRYSCQISAASL